MRCLLPLQERRIDLEVPFDWCFVTYTDLKDTLDDRQTEMVVLRQGRVLILFKPDELVPRVSLEMLPDSLKPLWIMYGIES